MSALARFTSLARRQKIAVGFGVFVLLYALAGFLLVPYVLRTKVPPALSDLLGRPVSIEHVSFNPFALALAVRGFRVDDTDGKPLVSLGELDVNVQTSSIFRRALTFKEIRLASPSVRLRVMPDGRLSFADVVDRLAKGEETAEPAAAEDPFPLIIQRAAIENGRVALRDESRRTPFEEEIAPIDIVLNDFATRAGEDSRYSFTAITESGASLTWAGTLSASPLRSSGEIKLTDFRSRTPWRYLRDDLRFEIASGTAAASAKYAFDGAVKPPRLEVSDATFALQNITMFEEGKPRPVVLLPALSATGGHLDLGAREIRIASITSNGSRIQMLREADGGLRIVRILSPRDDAPAAAPAPEPAPANPAPPWKVTVDAIHLADYAIELTDESTPSPAHLLIAPVSLDVEHLSTADTEPAKVKLGVGFEQGGQLLSEGTLNLSPVAASTSVKLTDFAVALLQPYVDQASGLAVRSGSLSTDLQISYGGGGETKTALSCSGGLSLVGVDVGVRGGEDLLALSKLGVEGLSFGLEPTAITIAKLDIVEPKIHIARRADGSTNLSTAGEPMGASGAPVNAATPPSDVAASAGAEAPPSDVAAPVADAAAPTPRPRVELPLIAISNGGVTISDASLLSPFTLTLEALTGEARGFALRPDARVDVDLAGKIARTGTLDVDAKLTPLAESPDGKLRFVLKNLDMSGFSPYSGKYVGQQIAKGKLGLDLDYAVSRAKLTAENKIGLDAFTLGKRVESPDATDLPVGLALALLKDTSGRIALDVPVSGRLDDPAFRIGKVILQTLRNLILKAATAPFALLGGLVGGGDELGRIAFAPGRANISESETAKLDKLAKALTERPTLKLEVAGATDSVLDPPALGAVLLEARLKAMRFAEIRKRSDAPASAEAVVLEEKHYDRLLEEAYETDTGKRVKELRREAPEPADGEPEIDVDAWTKTEMQRRLIVALAVGERELSELAARRADAIMAHLVQGAALPADRVFVTAPRTDATVEADAVLVELALAPA